MGGPVLQSSDQGPRWKSEEERSKTIQDEKVQLSEPGTEGMRRAETL